MELINAKIGNLMVRGFETREQMGLSAAEDVEKGCSE